MHFLIVELKLHADAAATGGFFFLSVAFSKRFKFYSPGQHGPPLCPSASQQRGLKAVKRVLWTSTVTAEVSKLPPGNKKSNDIFPCTIMGNYVLLNVNNAD